jgi:hypothetical protein
MRGVEGALDPKSFIVTLLGIAYARSPSAPEIP